MSIRNYFRRRNGLPEPTGSISVALKSRDQWIVSQARFSLGVWPARLIQGLQVRLVPGQLNISCPLLLYLPVARTANTPVIPFEANIPDSPFLFRGHSVLIWSLFADSLSHTNDSPTADICGSLEYSNSFRKTLLWQLLSPYVSSPSLLYYLLYLRAHAVRKPITLLQMQFCKICVKIFS